MLATERVIALIDFAESHQKKKPEKSLEPSLDLKDLQQRLVTRGGERTSKVLNQPGLRSRSFDGAQRKKKKKISLILLLNEKL